MQIGKIVYCASAIVFDRDAVLLVMRAKAPAAGLWSFPGGHIRAGENAQAAAQREILEETGLTVELSNSLGQREIETRGADGQRTLYRLSVFAGTVPPGCRPRAASDAAAAKFVPLSELGQYRLTDGAEDAIQAALFCLQIHGTENECGESAGTKRP